MVSAAELYAAISRSSCLAARRSTLPPSNAVSLDCFDLAIIAILQKNNTTSQRVIGEAVNLSAPAVQRRIKRLEEAGVILAHVAVIDPAMVGRPNTIFVEVEMESERADLIDARSVSSPPRRKCSSAAT